MITNEREKKVEFVTTLNSWCPRSPVTQNFETIQMTRKVMASTLVLESLLSVSFLLALRLYHGNPDKKHKL